MAEIKAATNEKVFQITAFKGLNQNPDGDTKLKLGEAAVMENFRITRDGNLQRRPGTKTIINLNTEHPILGLWVGYVNGYEYMLGACNGKLYKFWNDVGSDFEAEEIGSVSTVKDVHIFSFSNIVYILDGSKYRQWDGTTLKEVEGYIPLVQIAIPPDNSTSSESSSLENVNRLTGKRRVWLSPDGNGATFHLPEPFYSLNHVIDFLPNDDDDYWAEGQKAEKIIDPDNYSFDAQAGTITFKDVPTAAVNRFEVEYDVNTDFRSQVENMLYAELFAGTQDTRIFLYGDGTNKTIYSGIDYNGNPRADYFPDLYEALVGDENTPITGMIRHYSSLACFKKDSAWSITANSLTLSEGLNIPAFYVTPVNKSIGLAAPGQVHLVLNSPFTLFGNDLYEWKNSSYYTSNLTRDERQAKRISDRVWSTLRNFKTEECYCFDDNDRQEYYICHNGEALVYNYAADAWSKFAAFPVSCMVSLHGEAYIGSPDGKIKQFDYDILSDDGKPIKAYWESGAMDFGQGYARKYAAQIWVGIKPEGNGEVWVTAQTDRSDDLKEKVVTTTMATFGNVRFDNWHFTTNYKPKMKRLKIKAKKFVFYKLIFECTEAETRATVLAADIRVRFTGMAK